jgi:hypothetical protein
MFTAFPDGWLKVQLNAHPEHRRGDSGAANPGNEPATDAPAGTNYWMNMSHFYFDVPYGDAARWWIDEVITKATPGENENYGTIYLGYWPLTGKWRLWFTDLSWPAVNDTTVTTHQIRWSTAPINSGNFSSADQIEPELNEYGATNNVRIPDWTEGIYTQFDLPEGTETANDTIYLALKDVSQTVNGDGHDAVSSALRTISYEIRPADEGPGDTTPPAAPSGLAVQ